MAAVSLAYTNAHRDERRAYGRARRANDPERIRAKDSAAQKRRRATKAEHIHAVNRARRTANGERYRSQQRAYRQRNLERIRQQERRRNEANRALVNAQAREWRRRNLEHWRLYCRVYSRVRDGHKMGAEGVYTATDVQALYDTQQGLCAYCGAPVHSGYHVEHKQPLSRGGSNWPSNLCISCPHCNFRKHDKTEAEFRAMLTSD